MSDNQQCQGGDGCLSPTYCKAKLAEAQALTPGKLEAREDMDEGRMTATRLRLREALDEIDRLRGLLSHQEARNAELKRRLSIYQDRDEAVEINRLHGVIHRMQAQIEGRVMPPDWLNCKWPTPSLGGSK